MYEGIIARAVTNRPKIETYLTERNIDLETAERYEVGYMSAFPHMAGAGECPNQVNSEPCKKCSTCEANHWNKTIAWQTNRLVIPARGASGKITAIVTRSLTNKFYTFYDTPWGHVEGPLLGFKQALTGIDRTRTVRPVEGVFDTLAFAQAIKRAYDSWDDVNVVGLMTVGITEEKLKQLVRYADHLQPALDKDKSGIQMAKRMQEELQNSFKTIEPIFSHTKDWALWNEHNRKEFEKWVRKFVAV